MSVYPSSRLNMDTIWLRNEYCLLTDAIVTKHLKSENKNPVLKQASFHNDIEFFFADMWGQYIDLCSINFRSGSHSKRTS